jgi:hypothetical protein
MKDIKDLLFCPIDLEVPDFGIYELGVTAQKSPIQARDWNVEYICSSFVWRDFLDSQRQHLKEWLISNLPFSRIEFARLNEQIFVAGPHVDHAPSRFSKEFAAAQSETEPSGYRLVLKGDPNALKIHYSGKIIDGYVSSVPGIYLINSMECIHQLLRDENRISVYLRGTIDRDKHRDLIEKSLEKYGKHAIWKN